NQMSVSRCGNGYEFIATSMRNMPILPQTAKLSICDMTLRRKSTTLAAINILASLIGATSGCCSGFDGPAASTERRHSPSKIEVTTFDTHAIQTCICDRTVKIDGHKLSRSSSMRYAILNRLSAQSSVIERREFVSVLIRRAHSRDTSVAV